MDGGDEGGATHLGGDLASAELNVAIPRWGFVTRPGVGFRV